MDVWAIGSDNAISAPLADQYSFEVTNRKHFSIPASVTASQPTAENFVQVWQTNPFGQYLFNSTLVAVFTVILNLLFVL